MAYGLLGTKFESSSSFSSGDWNTVFGPQKVQYWPNVAITVYNNSADAPLVSGSVEWSSEESGPYETDWDIETFATIPAGGVRSMQVSGNSRAFLRLRAISSGTLETGVTGSLNVVVTTSK